MLISITSQRETKTCWTNLEKMLVVQLSFLYIEQLLTKPSFGKRRTYANQLLALMPAKYTPIRCVKPCPLLFTRVGVSYQKPEDSHFDKTKPVALKIRLCFVFNEQELIVKLRDFTLQADRIKSTVLVLVGFVLIAMLCLEL